MRDNGSAAVGDAAPFRLSIVDTRPQQRPIQLDDGSVIHGYVKGKRTLRSVEAAFLDAWRTGHNEDGSQRTQSEFDESLTQMVMAVIPQMTHEDADSLDRNEVWQLLEYLGWFTKVQDDTDPKTATTTATTTMTTDT